MCAYAKMQINAIMLKEDLPWISTFLVEPF